MPRRSSKVKPKVQTPSPKPKGRAKVKPKVQTPSPRVRPKAQAAGSDGNMEKVLILHDKAEEENKKLPDEQWYIEIKRRLDILEVLQSGPEDKMEKVLILHDKAREEN